MKGTDTAVSDSPRRELVEKPTGAEMTVAAEHGVATSTALAALTRKGKIEYFMGFSGSIA
jgi:hypothetical protein